jgi:uncharacterized protein (TIGR02596 family)
MRSRLKQAFSLVELLVVIAIIGIIATFAVPAVQGMLKGSALTTAAGLMVDQVSLARQHALSKNRIVEVRFYRFADNEIPGEVSTDPETGHFRALQYFEMSEAGVMVPVGKVARLPDTVIMNPGPLLSNLLMEDPNKVIDADSVRDPAMPRGVEHDYKYVAFRFFPDGTTSLSSTGTAGKGSEKGRWYITVHAISDLGRTQDNTLPPPNFFTWFIDPVSGNSKVLRPGVGRPPTS